MSDVTLSDVARTIIALCSTRDDDHRRSQVARLVPALQEIAADDQIDVDTRANMITNTARLIDPRATRHGDPAAGLRQLRKLLTQHVVVELTRPQRYQRYVERVDDGARTLVELLDDPMLGDYLPHRLALLEALWWLETEITCGDCVEGRCHWGGDRSRAGVAAVSEADPAYDDPDGGDPDGPCGCRHHYNSVAARIRDRRWAAAGVDLHHVRAAVTAGKSRATDHGNVG